MRENHGAVRQARKAPARRMRHSKASIPSAGGPSALRCADRLSRTGECLVTQLTGEGVLKDRGGEFLAGHSGLVEQILGGDTFTFCDALEVLPGVLRSATLVVEQEDVGTLWS